MSDRAVTPRPAVFVALAGWAVPGLGYWLIGERGRGILVGATILFTFVYGLLVGGVRVVDVPGYRPPVNDQRDRWQKDDDAPSTGTWHFRENPSGEIINKPWYIAQALTGPINIIASYGSVAAAEHGMHASTARTFDIGTLYTAVAGMLNLLVIMDSIYLGTRPPRAHNATEPA